MAREITFPASLTALSPLAEWLNAQMAALPVDEGWRFALDLAVCEVATNIIRHSLHEQAAATFSIAFAVGAQEVQLTFRDNGEPFPAERLLAAQRENGLEMAPDLESGRGMKLILLSVDSFNVQRQAGVNIATLCKKWGVEEARG
ncbi:ATP-binding protein [Kosakonia cowanii]|uniref:ATP-binding protein n=1 Tax=Kosakonia cowanii TaxID=208223 RepID=UPI00320899BB